MKIYVAGPYSNGDVAKNVHKAIRVGEYLSEIGHIPFIPHLTHFWHMIYPHDYEFWMSQDVSWLVSCDALFRIPGESAGADREVAHAKSLSIPIFYDVMDVPVVQEQ